jgi:Holliday junction DNA helicase RuvA
VYDYLEGRVAERAATRLVLDVGGVGWELSVPLGASFEQGGTVRAWTHQIVRETEHRMYGFADRLSRETFRLLLGVKGVGPAMALAILSGITSQDLVEAVSADDVSSLVRVKGIGNKTAQQILLDLRDRLDRLSPELGGTVGAGGVVRPAGAAPTERNLVDAESALVSIGFSEKDARKSVENAAQAVGTEDLELLVRTALKKG